jgi:hypothetical protein
VDPNHQEMLELHHRVNSQEPWGPPMVYIQSSHSQPAIPVYVLYHTQQMNVRIAEAI